MAGSLRAASCDGGRPADTDLLVFRAQAPHLNDDLEDVGSEGSWGSDGEHHARRRAGRVIAAVALLVGCIVGVACFPAAKTGAREQGQLQLTGLYAAPAGDPEPEAPSGPDVLVSSVEPLPWDEAERKAREVEAQLTAEERAALLHGTGFLAVNNWVGTISAIPRLGVPALKLQDSSNGFRPTAPGEFGTSTSWPSALALAACWDEGIVQKTAQAIAREFRAKGSNVILGPGVNVHRTPYGGRNFEYLSGEDPHLGSVLAAAWVKAVQREGVMAVVKHFAFNEQETKRDSENSLVAERTAWELYYPPFEAAVRAGAGAIMCSYNRLNGTHACGNDKLLLQDLKSKMGFAGFVMSDWEAAHHTKDLENGLDMEQPSGIFFKKGLLANISQASVREAARRVLSSIYHLRLDENPGCALPCVDARKTNVRTPEHVNLAEQAATSSVVLLKNDGVLPLNPANVRTLAVLGPAARARDTMNTWGPGSPYSGGGSGHVASPDVVTPLQGIKERAQHSGIAIVSDETDGPESTDTEGSAGGALDELNLDVSASGDDKDAAGAEPDGEKSWLGAMRIAEQADAVVVVAGATATESKDRTTLALDKSADDLIAALAKMGKPVIVLMEVPGAVLTPWRDSVSAAACLFLGGEVTGRAWASILFGDYSPRGKLPIALPATEMGAIKPGTVDVPYTEGLFTSYRSASSQPAYPFGFGLTYTSFALGQPVQVTGCSEPACIELTVTNMGQRPGSEVIQAYLAFDPALKGPFMTLRSFHRTRLLQPRESEIVRLSFTARDLSSYIIGRGWVQQEWVVARVGTSSADVQRSVPLRTRMPMQALQ